MKNQQVVVDYVVMLKSCCTCLALAFAGYILIKLVQAVFWFPSYLESNQQRLYDELLQKCNVTSMDENNSMLEKITEPENSQNEEIKEQTKKEK